MFTILGLAVYPAGATAHQCANRCNAFCINTDVRLYLNPAPVPHDTRCGCVICPDCRAGTPCANCDGGCVVCNGTLPPGPVELPPRRPPPAAGHTLSPLTVRGSAIELMPGQEDAELVEVAMPPCACSGAGRRRRLKVLAVLVVLVLASIGLDVAFTRRSKALHPRRARGSTATAVPTASGATCRTCPATIA